MAEPPGVMSGLSYSIQQPQSLPVQQHFVTGSVMPEQHLDLDVEWYPHFWYQFLVEPVLIQMTRVNPLDDETRISVPS